MNHFSKLLSAVVVGSLMVAGTAALADEPIVGSWKTESGETAAIAPCGDAYCITLTTGKFAGERIGNLSGQGSSYSGTVTDPEDSKEYSGSATVGESEMKLRGCALKIFCKTQTWGRL